jgi:hypothetical protein
MGTKTKKLAKNKNSKHLTLSKLRKSLEHIKRCALTMSVASFMKEYKKCFGREITKAQAEDYMKSLSGKKSQGGGAASVGYELRPGADTPYGNFPPYVSSGFGFANVDSTIGEAAGFTKFPSPGPTMGSNLVGGSKKARTTRKNKKQSGGDLTATLSSVGQLFSRPFPAAVPPSYGQDLQGLMNGGPGFPSPNPTSNNINIASNPAVHSINQSKYSF